MRKQIIEATLIESKYSIRVITASTDLEQCKITLRALVGARMVIEGHSPDWRTAMLSIPIDPNDIGIFMWEPLIFDIDVANDILRDYSAAYIKTMVACKNAAVSNNRALY